MKNLVKDSIEAVYNELDRILPNEEKQKINVLYVDDEPMNLTCFKSLFRRDSFKVFTANGSKEAFKILEKNRIQVVISDYAMPEINGAQFLSMVHYAYPNIISMGLTAYDRPKVRDEFKTIGHTKEVISKPFKATELKQKIKEAYRMYIFNFAENLST